MPYGTSVTGQCIICTRTLLEPANCFCSLACKLRFDGHGCTFVPSAPQLALLQQAGLWPCSQGLRRSAAFATAPSYAPAVSSLVITTPQASTKLQPSRLSPRDALTPLSSTPAPAEAPAAALRAASIAQAGSMPSGAGSVMAVARELHAQEGGPAKIARVDPTGGVWQVQGAGCAKKLPRTGSLPVLQPASNAGASSRKSCDGSGSAPVAPSQDRASASAGPAAPGNSLAAVAATMVARLRRMGSQPSAELPEQQPYNAASTAGHVPQPTNPAPTVFTPRAAVPARLLVPPAGALAPYATPAVPPCHTAADKLLIQQLPSRSGASVLATPPLASPFSMPSRQSAPGAGTPGSSLHMDQVGGGAGLQGAPAGRSASAGMVGQSSSPTTLLPPAPGASSSSKHQRQASRKGPPPKRAPIE